MDRRQRGEGTRKDPRQEVQREALDHLFTAARREETPFTLTPAEREFAGGGGSGATASAASSLTPEPIKRNTNGENETHGAPVARLATEPR